MQSFCKESEEAYGTGLNYYRANFQLERFAATRPARMAPCRCPVMGVW